SAGLASSSSVFMVTAEAIVALNGLSMTDEEFVQACGYGEWYVGTRGGCGDHAAMHYGRRGQVCHIELHPFRISYCPFPTGHSIVAFNSFETAHKAGNARDIFNQRVACYEFGLMLIQTRHPDLRERLIYFRDINPNVVGDTATVYQLLRELPQRASLDEVKQLLPYEMHERVIQIASQHSPPKDGYPIRGVCLFGVAECERSNRCTVLLSDGRVNEFGELMNISHDGDRVAKLGDDGEMHTYASPCDDEHLQKLIASIHSDSSALRESAQLWRQPGSYRCSTPAIDFMVDVALSVDGVIGAQISGAGLGGCIMVLVRTDAVERLISAMTEYYYEPRSYEPCYVVGVPIAGSGVLTLN
ncbi:MAG TPA: hypothetical protein EYP10_04030, partial [Armatimonadetes bacterium]|nr:hypothetical protein [Armatimonadota bacterium]